MILFVCFLIILFYLYCDYVDIYNEVDNVNDNDIEVEHDNDIEVDNDNDF